MLPLPGTANPHLPTDKIILIFRPLIDGRAALSPENRLLQPGRRRGRGWRGPSADWGRVGGTERPPNPGGSSAASKEEEEGPGDPLTSPKSVIFPPLGLKPVWPSIKSIFWGFLSPLQGSGDPLNPPKPVAFSPSPVEPVRLSIKLGFWGAPFATQRALGML